MRRLKKIGLLAMALACAGLFAPVAGAATVIDLFSDGGADILDTSADVGGVWDSQSPLTDVIGGSRELFVLASNVAGDAPSDARTRVTGGTLIHESSPDTGNNLGEIIWDGAADDALNIAGLGGVALDANGEDRFLVVSKPLQPADAFVTIDVWDMLGVQATGILTILGSNNGGTSTNHYLNFSSFSNFGIIDFGNVGAIRFTFDDDVRMSSVMTVVPVPGAAGLGLLGMMVVGGLRRRKKASAA